jgi:hypothetical protein
MGWTSVNAHARNDRRSARRRPTLRATFGEATARGGQREAADQNP